MGETEIITQIPCTGSIRWKAKDSIFGISKDRMLNCKQYNTVMSKWDAEVSFDLFYVIILFALMLLGLVIFVNVVKKFGVKRTCRQIRNIFTFHWLFKLIIYFRSYFSKGPIVVIEENLNNFVENDVDFVKEIINKETDEIDLNASF